MLAGVLILSIAYSALNVDDTNTRVADEIHTNPDGERALRSMLLTLAEGRMYPVNFLREDILVFMRIDGRCWQEFVGGSAPDQPSTQMP